MRVHLLIPAGDGGVFQHTIQVARYLRNSGARVTVHMPDVHEKVDLGGIDVCKCVRWRVRVPHPALRRPAVVALYLLRTLPHLLRSARRGDVVHVEGLFRMPLTAAVLIALTLAGHRVVHSPHNTFSRENDSFDAKLVRFAQRLAGATIVFNARDEQLVRKWGGRPFESPLAQVVPLEADQVEGWRRRWSATGAERVVLLAGQIRQDKRPDLLVRSATSWPEDWRLALVGEDKGGWEPTRRLAEELGVAVDAEIGFVDLDAFTAALAAADVVACPYDVSSQSGVVSVANSVGTTTLATRVGGLAESADVAIEPGDVDALTEGIQRAMAIDKSAAASDEQATMAAHGAAYAATQERRDVRHRLRALLSALG